MAYRTFLVPRPARRRFRIVGFLVTEFDMLFDTLRKKARLVPAIDGMVFFFFLVGGLFFPPKFQPFLQTLRMLHFDRGIRRASLRFRITCIDTGKTGPRWKLKIPVLG